MGKNTVSRQSVRFIGWQCKWFLVWVCFGDLQRKLCICVSFLMGQTFKTRCIFPTYKPLGSPSWHETITEIITFRKQLFQKKKISWRSLNLIHMSKSLHKSNGGWEKALGSTWQQLLNSSIAALIFKTMSLSEGLNK